MTHSLRIDLSTLASRVLRQLLTVMAIAPWMICGDAAANQLTRLDPEVEVPSVSVSELAGAVETSTTTPRVIDVRLKEDFEADPVLIPSAMWLDPNDADVWAKDFAPETPVVVYCVRGHWVSQAVTKKLLDLGLKVSRLTGGIEAWKAAGKPTTNVP